MADTTIDGIADVSSSEDRQPPPGGRQAVVVIHGIGQQRPMDTIRGFVRGVRGRDDTLYAVPDITDTTFELHTLVAPANDEMDRTDFYEGYWAPETRGTRLAHVLTWGRRLLLRAPRKLPSRVRRVALAVAFWVVVTLALLVWVGADVIDLFADREVAWLPAAGKLLGALATSAIIGWLTDSLGDAARYLDAHPRNVAMRTAIRGRVVKLLQRLHEEDEYDRIVVVGHSLGGVVAYDAVRLLWRERMGSDARFDLDDAEVAAAADELLEAVRSGDQRRTDEGRSAFHTAQASLFAAVEAADAGRWRITDLVTLGAPLAHAAWLLSEDGEDLAMRIEERELPTCPPQPAGADGSGYLYGAAPRRFHHGAVFALTRWTNLWFRGDPVGGPVRAVGDLAAGPLHRDAGLGAGVKDIRLDGPRWLFGGLRSHSTYWQDEAGCQALRTVLTTVAIRSA